MAVKLLSSSGGSVTLDVPVTASNFALTVPAANGTVITTGSTGQVIPKAALPTGSVLQVANTNITSTFNTSSSSYLHASNHSLSLTSIGTNSRFILFCNTPPQINSGAGGIVAATAFRTSLDSYTSNIGETIIANATDATNGWKQLPTMHAVIETSQSAGTAITFRVYVKTSGTLYFPDPWQYNSFSFNFMAMEIAA